MTEWHLSRRRFLLSYLASVAASLSPFGLPGAWAAKHKASAPSGPHPLARQDWPPAIVPDHIGVDKGYCVFTDEFGRLAVVDMRKPDSAKTPPHVVAELSGLGKKVVAFQLVNGRGYAVVAKSNDTTDAELVLLCLQFSPITDPVVAGQLALDKFSEVTSLSAGGDTVCIAGVSASGDNIVLVYSVPKHGRQVEMQMLSSWTSDNSIVSIDLQDRSLVVLEPNKLHIISLLDPRSPEVRQSVELDGDFKTMARFKDTVMVAGTSNKGATVKGSECVAVLVAVDAQPRVVSQVSLDPISTVLDSAAQKDRFVVLGDGATDRFIATLPYDKTRHVFGQQVGQMPKEKGSGFGGKSSIVLNGKMAFVASGWTGVQVLTNNGSAWQLLYNYTIPRLPASSIAIWQDKVVLAGSDLKLYDISQPDRPSLVSTTSLSGAVRSIVGAGSFVLCLARDAVSLRKMDGLDKVVASTRIAGQQMCFDLMDQKAYVLQSDAKKTTVTKLKVYSNEISPEKAFDLPNSYSRISAHGGSLAACSLNDITLFAMTQQADVVGTRHFENLGIRDICLLDDCMVATAVDQRSKGFLLILSKDQKDLRVLGSIDLPHDGVALSAIKGRAVAVGKGPDGNDIATVIDTSSAATPKLLVTMPAVEAASAVAIKGKYAIVAGRGLEILGLS